MGINATYDPISPLTAQLSNIGGSRSTDSKHFGGKRLEKMPKGQIGHSESIWTTSVGKYWKSCKTANIGHSKSIQNTSVGKCWKSCKMAKTGYSKSIQTTLVGKYWKSCKTAKLAIPNKFGPLW